MNINPLKQDTLFDADQLEQALARNPEQYLKLFKQAVSDGREGLRQAFEQGEDPVLLVFERARFMDRILQQAYRHCFAGCKQQLALLAVGGYGRGELHPYSDVDLMILVDATETESTRDLISAFFTLLWDIRLEIGHSVRTVEDCIQEAEADITVATNIMEARLLAGNEDLFERMQAATGPDRVWDSKAFFQAKLDEQIQRHAKFHDTAYNLEPNIKENPGGLRDIQMIGWVAKRHFGAQTLAELVDHGFLTPGEYRTLSEGEQLLWRIRSHLHYMNERREDRLLFDFQRDLALAFGYEDGDNNLAIEAFMQRYYRVVMELERLNELLLQLFREAILYADQPEQTEVINERFVVRNEYIATHSPATFKDTPTALLEIFLILEMRPDIRGVRAETIRLIRENRHLIDDHFRKTETARQLFMDIMRQRRGVTHELRRMNRYGILAAYIPAFEQIVGRMQYDLFHAYTVDQHTLFVLRNLRRLSVPEYAHEYPLASGVFHHLPKPELLYLAGLFHDIAKGRGGRHEELGAQDAMNFCIDHGLPREDAELVAWLVRYHLLMSMVAQRKDISDPEVVSEFARQIVDQMHLDYLYLLTICDIRGTNPKHWNTWKDSLLADLYHKTSSALRAGLDNPTNREVAVHHTRTYAQRLLTKAGYMPDRVNALWQHFTDDYFLHHSPYQVRWHTELILRWGHRPLPMVAAEIGDKGHIEILIYAKEQNDLFARVASTLDQLGLTIVEAQLMATDEGNKLESFKVLEEDGQLPSGGFRIKEIIERLNKRLAPDADREMEEPRPASRVQKHFKVQTRVRFEQLPNQDVTVMHITTNDRPGLLARIAQAFVEQNVRIHSAKIATAGEEARDIFNITDCHNRPLIDENAWQNLRKSIIEHLNQ